jgi:hypothetical protein
VHSFFRLFSSTSTIIQQYKKTATPSFPLVVLSPGHFCR